MDLRDANPEVPYALSSSEEGEKSIDPQSRSSGGSRAQYHNRDENHIRDVEGAASLELANDQNNTESSQNPKQTSGRHSGQNHLRGYNIKPGKGRPHPNAPQPCNSIALKNLDGSLTALDIENIVREVTGSRESFVNVAMVDDRSTGEFRGIAFVNFHTVEDAATALPSLASLKIKDRKVVAEYRRFRPGEKERLHSIAKRNKKYDSSNAARATFEMEVNTEVDEFGNEVDKRATFFAKRDNIKKADDRQRTIDKLEREKEMQDDFRSQLLEYRDAPVPTEDEIEDMCFDTELSSSQRRIVHLLCDELGLGHISRTVDGSRVLLVTKHLERTRKWSAETADARLIAGRKANEKAALAEVRRNRYREMGEEQCDDLSVNSISCSEASNAVGDIKDMQCGVSIASSSADAAVARSSEATSDSLAKDLSGIKWFRPKSALRAEADESGGPCNILAPLSNMRGIDRPSYKIYMPSRQPTGPDGTTGFLRRSTNLTAQSAEPVSSSAKENDLPASMAEKLCVDPAIDSRQSAYAEGSSTLTIPVVTDENNEVGPENRSRKSKIVLNPNVPPFIFPSV